MHPAVEQKLDQIKAFCEKWRVREFSLFDSVLREDFGPDSDLDVLVDFEPDARMTLFDLGEMHEELVEIFGREVDLVDKVAVERSRNPYRKREILEKARVVHAA